jgi:outer membrane receptor for monomeric catechols
LNAAYNFGDVSIFKSAKLKLNITNLFDKDALGMINSQQTNAKAYTSGAVTIAASTPNYTPLAPRSFSVMIGADM